MSAEQWPTEAAATAAVEALAEKLFSGQRPGQSWADADPLVKHHIRESVLPLVWDVINVLPDPRHAAWEEGWSAGESHDRLVANGYPMRENPYPAP